MPILIAFLFLVTSAFACPPHSGEDTYESPYVEEDHQRADCGQDPEYAGDQAEICYCGSDTWAFCEDDSCSCCADLHPEPQMTPGLCPCLIGGEIQYAFCPDDNECGDCCSGLIPPADDTALEVLGSEPGPPKHAQQR